MGKVKPKEEPEPRMIVHDNRHNYNDRHNRNDRSNRNNRNNPADLDP
tara:strand:+ start:202 stop:342 length:141 start_codon:yes stop_codon:yes gene_type:complete